MKRGDEEQLISKVTDTEVAQQRPMRDEDLDQKGIQTESKQDKW